ncbi:hypothetical protein FGRMN_1728 [Fusarium graminum]|nr:hypothetical protein FGRMN_1728 [Fusarium graminum]
MEQMIAPAPPGHFPHQQPISSPNRTSRDAPPRTEPTDIETHHHANHPATLPVLGMQLPVIGTMSEPSRAQSRAHLSLDINLDLHAHSRGIQSHGQVHDSGHGTHSADSSAGMSPAGFASHLPPASSGPMSLDWNMYHVPPNLQLNPAHFDFEIPGHMGVVGHPNHLAQTATNSTPYAYGSNLVSPSNIHPNSVHFDAGAPSQWHDSLGHDASTPKAHTPAHQIASNPWAEIDEPPYDNTSTSRARKTPRPRRVKKESRKFSDASQGGRSSSTGGTAQSVSDAASPSSASQNSRTSLTSKSVSMASTASASATSTSSRQSKLRSASRTSKNSRDKPNDTPEDRRTRASHNLVEKQYRNRLNAQFESLLSALPEQIRHGDSGSGNGNEDNESDQANDPDRRVSKGEVLEMARKHIEALERERNQLELENLELQGNIQRLKGPNAESTTSSSGQGVSTEYDTSDNQNKSSNGSGQNEDS